MLGALSLIGDELRAEVDEPVEGWKGAGDGGMLDQVGVAVRLVICWDAVSDGKMLGDDKEDEVDAMQSWEMTVVLGILSFAMLLVDGLKGSLLLSLGLTVFARGDAVMVYDARLDLLLETGYENAQ